LEAVGPDVASRIDKLHVENDPPVELVEFAVTFFAAVHAVVEVGHLKNTLVVIFVSKRNDISRQLLRYSLYV